MKKCLSDLPNASDCNDDALLGVVCLPFQFFAHAAEHRADRVVVLGGLLRSDLLQLLALPFDVRGDARL